MTSCMQCGSPIAESARYCSACGTKQVAVNLDDPALVEDLPGFAPSLGSLTAGVSDLPDNPAAQQGEPIAPRDDLIEGRMRAVGIWLVLWGLGGLIAARTFLSLARLEGLLPSVVLGGYLLMAITGVGVIALRAAFRYVAIGYGFLFLAGGVRSFLSIVGRGSVQMAEETGARDAAADAVFATLSIVGGATVVLALLGAEVRHLFTEQNRASTQAYPEVRPKTFTSPILWLLGLLTVIWFAFAAYA